MKILSTILFALLFVNLAFGQLQKTMHQTFDPGDATSIQLDLYGNYDIEFWAGNNILTETRIELYNASASILNHFVDKEQRYLIESDSAGIVFVLRSHDKKRDAIRTKNGECFELAHLKIFIPDKFYLESPSKLMLK